MSGPRTILPLLLLLVSGASRAETSTATAHGEPATNAVGSIVRSKEWIVRRGKSREEEFVGEVRYDAAGTKLSSDWALYRQGPNDWHARGNVYARREFTAGDVVETNGAEAWYNENTLKGRLEPLKGGRVPLLRTPLQGAPDHADGDHLSWIGEQVGILTGRAHGWGPRAEFWADVARYERPPAEKKSPVSKNLPVTQSLDLKGNRPVIHSFTGGRYEAERADRIVAGDTPRRADLTGKAMGWIIYQSSGAATGADALRCGQGDRSEGPGPDERVSALLAPLGPGRSSEEDKRFWEAEPVAFAARACPWGPHAEYWADEAHYARLPDGQSLLLSGSRPTLHDFTGENEAALIADRIVAFDPPQHAVLTGRAVGWILSQSTAAPAGEKATTAPCGGNGRSAASGPDARVTDLLAPRAGSSAEEESRFREAEGIAYAARACLWISRADFWADEADYVHVPDRLLTLTGGRPVLQKLDERSLGADDHSMAVKADRIVAFGSTRRIVATGKVVGWMVFKKDEKKSSDKDKKKSQEKK